MTDINKETVEEAAEETVETAPEAEETEKKPKKERELKWAKKAAKAKEEAQAEAEETEADKSAKALAEANDKYTRLFAEFDNFRKRSEKEKSTMYDFGAKDVIEKILPVIDNFERGFTAVEESDKEDAFVKGMDMVYKQLMQILEGIGVKPIEAVGKEFNTDFHQAVMHVEDDSVGANMVVEEFQKGYTYKDTVVRYSMVKVAN